MSTCMSVTSRLQGAHTREEKGVQVVYNLHSFEERVKINNKILHLLS